MTESAAMTDDERVGTPQGRCETTLTERFANPQCRCATYPGNLGPCKTFECGAGERCVYCDHSDECHAALASTGRAEAGDVR